jgi:NADH:ubiquinone oxidoreductase subunit 5 (subunit L)/multisubunit Na+/H+ antiporter MnhA subunit
VTALAFLVAGAAISGFPGFNGYASKTLLHHAIVETFEHHHVASLWFAEKIFTITGGLTFCYILRLFTSIFMGPAHGHDHGHGHKLASETPLERLIFGSFAAIILAGGLFPAQVIKNIIIPMSRGFSYDSYAVAHLTDINVWNSHDLSGIAVSLAIGIIAFTIFSAIGFKIPLPGRLSVEQRVYRPVLAEIMFFFTAWGSWFESFEHRIYKPFLDKVLQVITTWGRVMEALIEGSLVGSIGPFTYVARAARIIEKKVLPWTGEYIREWALTTRDRSYNNVVSRINQAKCFIRQLELSTFMTMIKLDYNPRGENIYRKLTLMNLDLCIFIVITFLVIVLSLRFLTMMGI